MLRSSTTLFKQFIRYLLFSTLSMMAVSCYVLADTLFIAHYVGEEGLAALNLILPTYFACISGPGMWLGIGAASYFSIYIGKRHFRTARTYYQTGVVTVLVYGVFITTIFLVFLEPICQRLGASGNILPLAKEYLGILAIFATFFAVDQFMRIFMRNDGNPHLGMVAILLANGMNILLDWVFMGPCAMGMRGAALATGVSPATALLVMAFHYFHEERVMSLRGFQFSFAALRTILPTGFPAYAMEAATGFVVLVFNFLLLKEGGDVAVSAYAVVSGCTVIAVSLFNGVGQGLQPLASVAYGASEHKHLAKLFLWAVVAAFLVGSTLALLVQPFAPTLVSFFNRDNNPALAHIAEVGLRLYFLAFFIKGINIVAINYFSATTAKRASFTLAILSSIILPISCAILFAYTLGIQGVWLSILVAETITLLFVPYFYRKRRME